MDCAQVIPCWIGFHTPSTSDRRGGPFINGQWSREGARIWVNGAEVVPPKWENAGYMPAKTSRDEKPLVNEGYAYREPMMVSFKQGWNRILVKSPRVKDSWKWMFTFLPLDTELNIEL